MAHCIGAVETRRCGEAPRGGMIAPLIATEDRPMPDTRPLFEAAERAATRAYAPYSHLNVGAAVRGASGVIHAGCNVENGAFPLGSCAEANAIGAAILAEGPEFVLQEVAISAHDTEGRAVTIPPCGGCRQRLLEFGSAVQVHFATAEGGVRSLALGVLLPESFRMGEDG